MGAPESHARAEGSRRSFPLPDLLTILAIVLVWASLLRFVVGHSFSIYDDAYIYFRYSANLLAGCGPTFNCGEPAVEGFSSPLFLLLVTLGAWLSDDVEAWSQVLGPACLGAALTGALVLGNRLHEDDDPRLRARRAVLGATALVLATDDYVLLNAVSGLETGLTALVIVMLVHAVVRRAPAATCAWAVLAVLARPECGVFVLLLPLLPWIRERRWVLSTVGALLVIEIVRYASFGDLLPNTWHAKSGGTWVHAQLGLAYLVEVAFDFPFILLAPFALLDGRRRREHAFVLAAAGLWAVSFLRTGGDHFAYGRLFVPMVPALTVLAASGVTRVLSPARWSPRACVVPVMLAAALVSIRSATQHHLAKAHGFPNVERWADVGRWLEKHHHGETIATIPVGAMAFFSGAPTLDLVGLTDRGIARSGNRVPPELMRRNWLGHERHDLEVVLQHRPQLVVTTKFRDRPWHHLTEASAGFYADWLFLQAIKRGEAPYEVYDAEVRPGLHWLVYRRIERPRPAADR